VTPAGIYPTPLWAAAQLVPSPQWHFSQNNDTHFGFTWQITPVLYSFGINRRLSPWRSFITEPLVRYNGSVELFISPEYAAGMSEKWRYHTGIRAYMPLYRYGEYLAASLSVSHYQYGDQNGVSYEAGMYMFFGILGLRVAHRPAIDNSPWSFTINLRYF
jgi:hypothetical protein